MRHSPSFPSLRTSTCRFVLGVALSVGCASSAWSQGYSFQTEFGSAGSGVRQFASPTADIDPSNQDIVVSDTGNGRMQRFSLSGTYLNEVAVPNSANYTVTQFKIDPISHNFVTFGEFSSGTFGSGAWEIFSSTGTELGSSVDPNLAPTNFVIDPATHHLVSGNYSTSVEILSTNNNGTSFSYLSKFGSSGSGNGQFNDVAGIALDTVNHQLAVTDLDARVQFFTTNGVFINSVSTGSVQPIAVAVDPAEKIFVVLEVNDTATSLHAFTYLGTDLGTVGMAGTGPGEIGEASSIAIDPVSHHLVVADYGNNKILVFAFSADQVFQNGFE